MDLTTDNVIQLYTPLAGLAMLAFWSGVLTQKIAGIIDRITTSDARIDERLRKVEAHGEGDTAIAVQIGVLTERVNALKFSITKVDGEVQTVQKTLNDIITKRPAARPKFDQTND